MNKQQRYNSLYMDIAKRVAKMSYARRLQVGAVVVKDDRVISMGFNGMPSGWDNNCEDIVEQHEDGGQILKTKPEVLHAESNAVSKLARSAESGLGADMFITHAPCRDCAKLIYQSGIKCVYFEMAYRDDSGIKFLEKSGVTVENFESNN